MAHPTFEGYDGNGYTVGDRVEIHPAADSWMRGDRYGEVVSVLKGGPNAGNPCILMDKSGRERRGVAPNMFRRVPD